MMRICRLVLAILFLSSFSVQAEEETLYKIIEQENLDAFSDMVILGYSVDEIGKDGYTPLIIASQLGKRNFVQFLILNDAVVNKRGKDGTVALHHASQAGNIDVIDLLCKNGAYINFPDYQGYTPLMYAILGNKIDAVEKIIDLGGDMNYLTAKNETPLEIARKKRFLPIVSLLEKKGVQ